MGAKRIIKSKEDVFEALLRIPQKSKNTIICSKSEMRTVLGYNCHDIPHIIDEYLKQLENDKKIIFFRTSQDGLDYIIEIIQDNKVHNKITNNSSYLDLYIIMKSLANKNGVLECYKDELTTKLGYRHSSDNGFNNNIRRLELENKIQIIQKGCGRKIKYIYLIK